MKITEMKSSTSRPLDVHHVEHHLGDPLEHVLAVVVLELGRAPHRPHCHVPVLPRTARRVRTLRPRLTSAARGGPRRRSQDGLVVAERPVVALRIGDAAAAAAVVLVDHRPDARVRAGRDRGRRRPRRGRR